MERLGRSSGRLRELRRRIRQRRPGEVVVDGRRLIGDLVRWDVPILELYVAAGSTLDRRLATAAVGAWEVDPAVFASVAPTRHPQGVMAVVPEPASRGWSGREGAAVFVEGVQDPGNVGAIVRAAAALGAATVLLSEGCADPYHPAAVRGSAGAAFRIPVERAVAVSDAVDRVRRGRGSVWAAAADGSPIDGWRPLRPTLLIVGAEGTGLSDEAFAAADGRVAVPLERDIESLNVAVAVGILLHHLRAGGQPLKVES